jgi:hypothetical protein
MRAFLYENASKGRGIAQQHQRLLLSSRAQRVACLLLDNLCEQHQYVQLVYLNFIATVRQTELNVVDVFASGTVNKAL